MTVRSGTVYLVGAGPGDPGLITVRGLELLERADVVLHDRLVSTALLEKAQLAAQLIDVGKTAWGPTISQEDINSALVQYALEGNVVVRLKGGDPLVFGRGWEEAEACRAAGVPCEIVPGISSALAGPAAAGIPVTCRGVASNVAILEAHEITPHALQLAALADTSVFLMGMRGLADLARRIVASGRDALTPAAVIEQATLPGQRVVRATLGNIAAAAANAGLKSPAIIVVGNTAAFGAVLAGPLVSRRIVVTRPPAAAHELTNGLRALGATVISAPLIQIALTDAADAFAACDLESCDWIVFTSRHAVRGFRRALEANGKDVRAFAHTRIAAVGPVTARELEAWGLRANLVPNPARADVLVRELAAQHPAPLKVLFPCGTLALDTIPRELAEHGISVHQLPVYETRKLSLDPRNIADIARGVDAVLFASPSAVTAFGESGVNPGNAAMVCIGPTTAAAAAQFNWRNVRVADTHADAGLIQATVATLALEVAA